MRKQHYSENPRDFRVGDTVKDTESGEIGIIQRIENIAWAGINTAAFVYLIRKGYVARIQLRALNIVESVNKAAGEFIDRALRNPHPEVPRPAHEVGVSHGTPRPVPTSPTPPTPAKPTSSKPTSSKPTSSKRVPKSPTKPTPVDPKLLAYNTSRLSQREKRELIRESRYFLEEEIKKIYGIGGVSVLNNDEKKIIGSIAKKVLSEMIDENGLQLIPALKNRSNVRFGEGLLIDNEPLDVLSWLERGARRHRDYILSIKKTQRILREFYSGKEYVPEVADKVAQAIEDVRAIAKKMGREQDAESLIEEFRRYIGGHSKASKLFSQQTGLGQEAGIGYLNPKREGVRRTAIALSEMLNPEVKSRERTLREYLQDIDRFGRIANIHGFRTAESLSESIAGKDSLGEFFSEDIREQSYTYGFFRDMDLREYNEFVMRQGELMQPMDSSNALLIREFRDYLRGKIDKPGLKMTQYLNGYIANNDSLNNLMIREFIEKYKQSNGMPPTEEEICIGIWGNYTPDSINRVRRALTKLPIVSQGGGIGEFGKYANTLSTMLEDVKGVNDTVILRPYNVAMRITEFDPLAEGGPKVTLSPVTMPLRTEVEEAGKTVSKPLYRLYMSNREGETPAQALLRIMASAGETLDIPDADISNLTSSAKEVFNRTSISLGDKTLELSRVYELLGVATNGTIDPRRVLRSKVGEQILNSLGISPATIASMDINELEDLQSELSTEIIATLTSNQSKFSAENFNEKFVKEVASITRRRLGSREDVLTRIGKPISGQGTISLSKEIADTEGLTIADTIADPTDYAMQAIESASKGGYAQEVIDRTIFSLPSKKRILREIRRSGRSNSILETFINSIPKEVSIADSKAIEEHLLNLFSNLSSKEAKSIAQLISTTARKLHRESAEQLFYGEMGAYGKIFSASVSAGKWKKEDLLEAVGMESRPTGEGAFVKPLLRTELNIKRTHGTAESSHEIDQMISRLEDITGTAPRVEDIEESMGNIKKSMDYIQKSIDDIINRSQDISSLGKEYGEQLKDMLKKNDYDKKKLDEILGKFEKVNAQQEEYFKQYEKYVNQYYKYGSQYDWYLNRSIKNARDDAENIIQGKNNQLESVLKKYDDTIASIKKNNNQLNSLLETSNKKWNDSLRILEDTKLSNKLFIRNTRVFNEALNNRHPLLEEVVGNLIAAESEEEKAYAKTVALRLASKYAEDESDVSNTKVANWLLEFIDKTVGYSNALPGGVRIENGKVFWDVEDINHVENIINALGKESFETKEVAGKPGIVITGEDKNLVVPMEGLSLNWEKDFPSAKTKGQYGMGQEGPSEAKIANINGPSAPHIVYDEYGTGFTTEEGYTTKMTFDQMMKSATFTDEERLLGMKSVDGPLPIWKVNDDSYIASSMEGGPEEQLARLKEVAANKEEYLALDIETYGPRYTRLGNVGIVKKKFGEKQGTTIYDRSFRGWKNTRRIQEATTDILGNVNDVAAMNKADMQMLTEAARIINKHPTAKIAVYNENVDLMKMAMMAKKHQDRIKAEISEMAAGASQVPTTPEAAQLVKRLAEMEKAYNTFVEANKNRAINVMFLESAITPEGGFQALSTAAARRGILKGAQSHTGAEDALLTAKVMEAGVNDYLKVDISKWHQLSAEEFKDKILYGHPTRMRDPYGNNIPIDISNRMLTLESIRKGIDPSTGGEQWAVDLVDANTTTRRTVFAEDALQLSTVIQNLREANLNTAQVAKEEDRIAKDLFNRRIHEILSGERSGTGKFGFEDIEWKMKLAEIPEEKLKVTRDAFAQYVESSDNPELRERLKWIDTQFLKDPRIRRQYRSGLDWFNNQYKVYDKPFFNLIEKEMKAGSINAEQAQHLIRLRWKEVYGAQNTEGALFNFAKEIAQKPFHEWTITPDITNSYRIRLATPQLTKYGIEEFVLRTFYRAHENAPGKALDVMRTALGKVANEQDLIGFFENGGVFRNNQVAYREILSRHLIENNFKFEGKSVVDLIRKAAGVPDNVSLELGMDATRNLAFGIRSYMQANMEKQLATNPSLNNEFEGVLWWKGIEQRGYKNRAVNRSIMLDYLNNFQKRIHDPAELSKMIRSEEEAMYKANPELRQAGLRLSSLEIPNAFMSGEYAPSVLNLTPRQVVSIHGAKGQTQLAKILIRDIEESRYGANGGFLTDVQRQEIKRVLNWQDMSESIKGITKGSIQPVEVNGITRDIGEAIVPLGGKSYYLRDFLASKAKDKILEELDKSSYTNNMFYEAVRRYFGDAEPRAVGGAPTSIGGNAVGRAATKATAKVARTAVGGTVNKDAANIASAAVANSTQNGPSVAKATVAAANAAIANSAPKGPSAARSANAVGQAWIINSGKAEDFGKFISGIMPSSMDDLGNKLRGLLKGSGILAIGGALLTLGVMSSRIGIRKSAPSILTEDDQINEPKMDNRVVRKEVPIHKSIHGRIKGVVDSNVDPNEIVNAVHAAIDMHSTGASDKSHVISNDRRKITKQEADKIAKKLLR